MTLRAAVADAAEGVAPTALHVELAGQISRLIHEEALEVGARLNEVRLAERLGVSRTPVRAALSHMATLGFVERKRNRGVELRVRPPLPGADGVPVSSEDDLLARIAADRRSRRLAEQVSKRHLMQTYGLTRVTVKQVLARLSDVGIIERKLGYRWRFVDDAYKQARQESYRFRLTIEPAAILQPGFSLAPDWAEAMRAEHEKFMRISWTRASSIAFFEMNAAFHEGIAKASGNPFFHESLQRLNRMRRLANYDWRHGRERVAVSCREHLNILERLQRADVGAAAALMREHLESASRIGGPPVDA